MSCRRALLVSSGCGARPAEPIVVGRQICTELRALDFHLHHTRVYAYACDRQQPKQRRELDVHRMLSFIAPPITTLLPRPHPSSAHSTLTASHTPPQAHMTPARSRHHGGLCTRCPFPHSRSRRNQRDIIRNVRTEAAAASQRTAVVC